MRPWTEKVYGVPPEQVVGSSGELKFEMRNDQPVLVKLPTIDFIDDKAGIPPSDSILGAMRKMPAIDGACFQGKQEVTEVISQLREHGAAPKNRCAG